MTMFGLSENTLVEDNFTAVSDDGSWMSMSVAGATDLGGRKHMEDYIFFKKDSQAFMAVFDGHGGEEAAEYARDNLWNAIKQMDGFDTNDSMKVIKAIEDGFVHTHEAMWKVRGEGSVTT